MKNLKHNLIWLILLTGVTLTANAQSASLIVTKSFSSSPVNVLQVVRLEIRIDNLAAGTADNVEIDDIMPTNMWNSSPDFLFYDTGGAVAAFNNVSSGELHLTGGAIPGFATRIISIDIYVSTPGDYNNQTSNIRWQEGGTPYSGGPGSASLSAPPMPPTATKGFAPIITTVGGTSVLTILINNPNNIAITTVAFSDAFPLDMTVAAPLTITNTCGGTIRNLANTAPVVAGDVGIRLVGGAIAASGNCSVSVTVSLAVAKIYNNTTSSITLDGGGLPGASTSGSVTASNLPPPAPSVALVKGCPIPANCTTAAQAPGTDVTYSIAFSNSGGASATNTIIVDPIPVNLDYKLGSATSSPGTTGITFVIEYSADNGATWAYVPVSGGGGAAAGYDRNVKIVRWRTSDPLPFTVPNNSGSVSFVARVQ